MQLEQHEPMLINQEFEALLEASPVVLFQLSEAGIVQSFSAGRQMQAKLQPGQYIDGHISALTGPEGIDWFLKGQHSLTDPLEFTLSVAEGTYWLQAKLVSTREDSLLAVITDITEKKQAELRLIESNHIFNQFSSVSANSFFLYNLTTLEITYYNSNMIRLLGYPTTSLRVMNGETMERIMHPDDLKTYPELLERYNGLGDDEILNSEYRLRDADGKWHWFYSRVRVNKRNKEGRPVEILGIAHDITHRKKNEEELRHSYEQLRQKNAELENFTYLAWHDLQEPLRMVTVYTQLLEKRYQDKLDKDGLEFLHIAAQNADRMNQLIRGLREYYDIEKRVQTLIPINARKLLQMARIIRKEDIEKSGAEISFDEQMPDIRCDAYLLANLFDQLFANAIKFVRPGIRPKISVQVKETNSSWEFYVQDNGIGFDMEYRDKIFGIFQRLHPLGVLSGNGIGLAICRKIMEKHDGSIRALSVPGEGSTFILRLPKELKQ